MTTQKRSRLTRAERLAAFAFNPDQLRWPKGTRWGGRWMDMPWKVGGDFLSRWLDFFDGQNTPALGRLTRAHLSKPGGLNDTVDRLDKDGLTTPENMADAALELVEKLEALRDDYYRSSVYVDSPEFADEIETSVRKAMELSDVSLDEWQQFIDAQKDTSAIGKWDDDADTDEPLGGPAAAALPEIDRPGWTLGESGSFETAETEPAYEHESGLAVVQDTSTGTWLVVDEEAVPLPFGDDRDFTVFHSVEEAFEAVENRGENPPTVVNGVAIPKAGTDPEFEPNNDQLWTRRPADVEKALEAQGYVFDDDLDQWVDPKFLAENMEGVNNSGGGSGGSGGSGGGGGDGDSGPDPRKVLADIEKGGWGPGESASDGSIREFYRDFSDEDLQAVLDADLEDMGLDPRVMKHVRGAVAREQARRNSPEVRAQKLLKQLRGMSVGDLEQAGREGGPDLEEMFEGFTDAELERADQALELSLNAGVDYQKTSAQQDAVNRELDRRRRSPKGGAAAQTPKDVVDTSFVGYLPMRMGFDVGGLMQRDLSQMTPEDVALLKQAQAVLQKKNPEQASEVGKLLSAISAASSGPKGVNASVSVPAPPLWKDDKFNATPVRLEDGGFGADQGWRTGRLAQGTPRKPPFQSLPSGALPAAVTPDKRVMVVETPGNQLGYRAKVFYWDDDSGNWVADRSQIFRMGDLQKALKKHGVNMDGDGTVGPYRDSKPAFADSKKSLRASAYAPTKPPVEFFKNPQLTEPTPMTVTPDGRVYGHVALWDTCHVGNPEGPAKCTQPPRSKSNYAYFHVGAVETAEGNEVAVGKLVQGTTHAEAEATAMQALAHYENTGLAVADVRAGEDRFGIWVSGALRHDLTDAQVKEFRAAPMSGDWRRMRGSLELVAALAVNVPGFPVPRPNGFVASGHVQSLVASGMVPPRKVKAPGSPGALSSEDLQYLKSLAARERANHAAQLATKVQEVKEADQIKKIKAFAERQRTRKG